MLNVAVLDICILGESLKSNAILIAPFCCFDLINLVVRVYHFFVQIVAFCKLIAEVLI